MRDGYPGDKGERNPEDKFVRNLEVEVLRDLGDKEVHNLDVEVVRGLEDEVVHNPEVEVLHGLGNEVVHNPEVEEIVLEDLQLDVVKFALAMGAR
jgi:hypothetical protein